MTKVVAVEHLNRDYFRLILRVPEIARTALPGQFVEVRIPLPWGLAIPISIGGIDGENISLLIKIVGEGTTALSMLEPGNEVECTGPLGRGFTLSDGETVLLVSGGVGHPALQLLDESLREGNDVTWLHGGRSAADCFPADETWTDDGSLGNRGFVTQGLETRLKAGGFTRIYACGPEPMLKAVASLAAQYGIWAEVSLEAYMACGIGVCHGCVVSILTPTGREYQRVCKEGPVFDAITVDWKQK